MTLITDTPFVQLDAEGRLLSPVFKCPTNKAGRFGFRGEVALEFQKAMADEKRPPETKLDQVMMVASKGDATIPFLAGFAHSLAHLKLVCEHFGDKLSPTGKYFFFAGNLDISKKYQIAYGGATFWVMPLDEATVYNELLDMFRMEKAPLKNLTPPASWTPSPTKRHPSMKSGPPSASRKASKSWGRSRFGKIARSDRL
jgi:hypothetical protein